MIAHLRAFGWQIAAFAAAASALALTVALIMTDGDRKAWMARADRAELAVKACEADLSNREGVIARQSADVRRWQAEADARAAEAAKARQEAARAAQRYRTRIARLEAAEPGPDQCESARGLIVETLEADR